MNAKIVEIAGIKKLKIYHMSNTNMARIKNFLTPQWLKEFEEMKRQASSSKRQAASKPKPEPSSGSETSSNKLQASSYKQQA